MGIDKNKIFLMLLPKEDEMTTLKVLKFAPDNKRRPSSAYLGIRQRSKRPLAVLACVMVTPFLLCGCSHCNEAIKDDNVIAMQQAEIAALKHKIQCRESRIIAMEKHIKVLEKKLFPSEVQDTSEDKTVTQKDSDN
jgi:hypothetical protein